MPEETQATAVATEPTSAGPAPDPTPALEPISEVAPAPIVIGQKGAEARTNRSAPRERKPRSEIVAVYNDQSLVYDYYTDRRTGLECPIFRGIQLPEPYGTLDGRPCDAFPGKKVTKTYTVDIYVHKMRNESYKVIVQPVSYIILPVEEYSIEAKKVVKATVFPPLKEGDMPVLHHPDNGAVIIIRRPDQAQLVVGTERLVSVEHAVNLYWGKLVDIEPTELEVGQQTMPEEDQAEEMALSAAVDTMQLTDYRMLNHTQVVGEIPDPTPTDPKNKRFVYQWSNVFSLLGIEYDPDEEYKMEYVEETYKTQLQRLHPDQLIGRSPSVQRIAAESHRLLEECRRKALIWIHVKINGLCYGESGDLIDGQRCDNPQRNNQVHCTKHLELFKAALLKMEDRLEAQSARHTNTQVTE